MMKRFFTTTVLIGLIFGITLLPKPHLWLTYPIWLAVVAAYLLELTAPSAFKHLNEKKTYDRGSVLALLFAGTGVFLVPLIDYAYFRQAHPPITTPWTGIAFVMVLGGLLFRYISIRTLGRFFTSVVRVQEGQSVIDHGPYKYIRHPSYLGAYVMAIGIAILFRSYVGLGFVLLGFTGAYIYRISAEEAALSKELGEAYLNYKKRTWRMIPLVY